jgi:anthranilate phosphoribosyltransferase
MSETFRDLLKIIGSGVHTGADLSREQAEAATVMMLQQQATPAQIGAFLIAHRIKRPSFLELAGMLDAYDLLGPHFDSPQLASSSVVVFGTPYDGRSRTVPVLPLSALLLAVAGVPVVLHGGERMPTKYGISLQEMWQALGVDFRGLSLAQLQAQLTTTGLTFVYTPEHFPLAQGLVPYRDEIGKRPPLATIELIWSPYRGQVHQIAGFVHPPTEERFRETLPLRGVEHFTTVKGLEGSCDLACSRTAIIGISDVGGEFTRLLLKPQDFGLAGTDVPLESLEQMSQLWEEILAGKNNVLSDAALLNGGFYLWRCGVCADLSTAFTTAEAWFKDGRVRDKCRELATKKF